MCWSNQIDEKCHWVKSKILTAVNFELREALNLCLWTKMSTKFEPYCSEFLQNEEVKNQNECSWNFKNCPLLKSGTTLHICTYDYVSFILCAADSLIDSNWPSGSPVTSKRYCEEIKKNQGVFVKHYAPGGNKVQKAIFSYKIKVKVTRSLTLVSFERASLEEYACQIWSLYLLRFKSYSEG